jgi:hypothetical protein
MSDAQNRDSGRGPAQAASSTGASGFPTKRNAYLRPQLTRTDLRKALSDIGTVDDGTSS